MSSSDHYPTIDIELTPRSVLMGLLTASDDGVLTAKEAVQACALFNIPENRTRVALARLAAKSLVVSVRRGVYRLGPAAVGIAADLADWRRSESRLVHWSGGYIAVLGAELDRGNRSRVRRRERALAIVGFRQMQRGLYVRPDNLVGGVTAVRERAYRLGLDSQAPVCRISELAEPQCATIEQLWNGDALTARYLKETRRLRNWLASAPNLSPAVAARDAFLLGNRAIRQVVFDPLLPPEFVDPQARTDFFATVREFDTAGQRIWAALRP